MTSSRADLTVLRGGQAECDCPGCSGEDVDPAQMVGDLLDSVTELAGNEDPLAAELAGAMLVAMVTAAGDELVPAFVQAVLPAVEARSGRSALALLLAVGSVASGVQEQVAGVATAASRRLRAAAVAEPQWAGELGEPLEVGDCLRLHDTDGVMSVLVASFRRAGRGHAFMVIVDEQHCGAAEEILIADAELLPQALDDIRTGAQQDGLILKTQAVDPAELHWYVAEALAARAVHDEEGPDDAASLMVDEDEGPPYPVLALLVRARLKVLPPPRRPAGAVRDRGAQAHAAIGLAALSDILGGPGAGRRGGLGGPGSGRLPAKRKKSAGPAPIFQLKVGLRGARPPIWRRLLVPADVSLAHLHDIIQVAFDWDDSHMHVFETPYGEFGQSDPELGHRAEAPVTLEQVVAEAKDKIYYTYDFGDDWVHEILVEKVLDREPDLGYPRCTGGRRAAPPEDCGGIPGYAGLVDVLADRSHPEHEDLREWLGLDDASQFDPAAFDVAAVNRALEGLR